jgi:hypothetical protein
MFNHIKLLLFVSADYEVLRPANGVACNGYDGVGSVLDSLWLDTNGLVS